MRRILALAAFLTFVSPLAHVQADTWREWRATHRIHVYAKGVSYENLLTRDHWLALRRNKIAVSYHHWRDARAAELAATSPVPGSPPAVLGNYTGDHEAMWLCIHAQEGSWTDPNPPYFGGLQMGYGFMEAYGGSLYAEKGTADHWTAAEQIGVAEAAWAANGYYLGWLFSQWPNTAPNCV